MKFTYHFFWKYMFFHGSTPKMRTLTRSLLHLWAFDTNCFEMSFSKQILDQLIDTYQKLLRQFIMINWIEYYDYKYNLIEGVCKCSTLFYQPQSNNLLKNMSVGEKTHFSVMLCYLVGDWWLVQSSKKLVIGKWLKSQFLTMDF